VDRDGRTILIVDDKPVNLGVVVDHPEHRGFEVAVALGGGRRTGRALPSRNGQGDAAKSRRSRFPLGMPQPLLNQKLSTRATVAGEYA
jgi:hypothetical protein